jgi:hypothetical protein
MKLEGMKLVFIGWRKREKKERKQVIYYCFGGSAQSVTYA